MVNMLFKKCKFLRLSWVYKQTQITFLIFNFIITAAAAAESWTCTTTFPVIQLNI